MPQPPLPCKARRRNCADNRSPAAERPGPQPENQIAATAAEQLERVHLPRPQPSTRAALARALGHIRDLERRLDRAGCPR